MSIIYNLKQSSHIHVLIYKMEKKEIDTKVKFEQIFETIDLKTRKTKIICTMGPSCWDVEMMVKLLDAGMDVCRLNFSHGDHKVIDILLYFTPTCRLMVKLWTI